MDIIDIILARALSSRGRIETYAAQAEKAAQDASAAATDAQTAADTIEAAADQITSTGEAAAAALEDANAAIEAANDAIDNINDSLLTYEDVDGEIKNLFLSATAQDNPTSYNIGLNVLYPDGDEENIEDMVIMHKQAGTDDSATMTQKAITDYIGSIKTELEQQIAAGGGSSGGEVTPTPTPTPTPTDEAVFYDINGNLITDPTTIENLIKGGAFRIKNAFGSEVDYTNKTIGRINDAEHPVFDINYYKIYTGRLRCNVADNGAILAWYGDSDYKDDGSNGQVMVYQPKFYYRRIPIITKSNTVGSIISKETLLISPYPGPGFKLHPLFYAEDGVTELDYVLLSAYEGSAFDTSLGEFVTNDASNITFSEDKLSSIADVKPISGANNVLTVATAEQLAQNRGPGWHITNMAFESANQILQTLEYNSFNSQSNIGNGISDFATGSSTKNYCSYTGSTKNLGNLSGIAESTINERDGAETVETALGKTAMSYRGVENLWGNIQRFIGGILVKGNGATKGGEIYACNNYTYSNEVNNNYTSTGMILANSSGWISSFGYNTKTYDWVFVPTETTGNSSAPIGDNLWVTANLTTTHILGAGGKYNMGDQNGIYYCAADHFSTDSLATYGARLMFIPTKNTIYNNNIAAWHTKTGG